MTTQFASVWQHHSTHEIDAVLAETIENVNLSNYRAKIATVLDIYQAGFELPVLQQSISFLENLRRAAMRCDPRVAQEFHGLICKLALVLAS